MDKNVVQLHERIRFHLDELDSPRYHADTIDEGINTAIGLLVDNIIDKGAQRTQKERDALFPLEVKDYPVFKKIGEDLLPITYIPDDYRRLLSMKLSVAASMTDLGWTGTITFGTTRSSIVVDTTPDVTIAVGCYLKVPDGAGIYVYVKIVSRTTTGNPDDTFGLERPLANIPTGTVTAYTPGVITGYNSEPTDYDEINVAEKDPYKKPDISTEPPRVFHIESSDGIHLFYGNTIVIIPDGRICYVKSPVIVNRGIEHVQTDGNFTGSQTVIAVEETVYSAVTYDIGDEINVTNGTNITSGKVVKSYTNSDLPNILFDIIAVGSAMLISERSGDEVRIKILQKYNNFGYGGNNLGHNQ